MKILSLMTLCACGYNVQTANPCATPGATYIASYNQLSGNCGNLPNVIININPDGTITFPSNISCQSEIESGCVVKASNCTFSNNGVSCNEAFDTTFTEDGSSASTLMTLSCIDSNQSCISTYSGTIIRQ